MAHSLVEGQTISVGLASNVRALRVNYVGELGWELHHPIEYQNQTVRHPHGRPANPAALAWSVGEPSNSMRMEKSYRVFLGRSESRVFGPWKPGWDRFICLQKPKFTGRDALLLQQREGLKRRFTVLKIDSDRPILFKMKPFIGKTSRSAGSRQRPMDIWSAASWRTPISICPTMRKEPRCTSLCWGSDARRVSSRLRHSIPPIPARGNKSCVQSRGMLPFKPGRGRGVGHCLALA